MRPEKEAIMTEITTRLREAPYAFLLNYSGLTVSGMSELRQAIAPLGGRALVAKNTMVGKVAEQLGWENISSMLTGPTAVITGKGDVSELAKLLVKFVKAHEKTAVKGACLDGKALKSADVDALSTLPPREAMLGVLVGTVAAPMTQLVGVFNQKLLSLLYVLKAVETKKNQAA
ncbi:MAG: 50S ribosomal protein L10 [Kiritimatiellae bacterium]|nr:50S ribosomal protein L10 [Kiritimatiellia bacterium]